MSSSCIDVVVVAVPEASVDATAPTLGVHVVAGGATREQSVRLALAALPADVDVVLVHDAARPLVPLELVDAVVRAVRSGAPAVVPGLPLTDTVKRVDARSLVLETPPRSSLRAVQTPQGFDRAVLERAYAASATAGDALPATDDAGLVERLGEPVLVIPGDPAAFKVTHPADLALAERMLTEQPRLRLDEAATR